MALLLTSYVRRSAIPTGCSTRLPRGLVSDSPSLVLHTLFCLCSSWMNVRVGATSLPKALHCWERSLKDKNRSAGHHGNHNQTTERSPPVRSCPLHLVDRCLWPNCNPTCPDIYDQQTGREVDGIQFLKHMGLDVLKMSEQHG